MAGPEQTHVDGEAQTPLPPDGTPPQSTTASTNGVYTSNPATPSPSPSPIPATPAYHPLRPHPLRIATIGAGYSGMILAHKLQHTHATSFPAHVLTHTIYESKPVPGGTWAANTYPGVQCDVPSHIYAFPFAPNPAWTHFYSSGGDILAYFQRTVREWGLDRDVVYNTTVTGARWDEERASWTLSLASGGRTWTAECDVLISARGILSSWTWPEITGLERFRGKKVHSADWDHAFDYTDKRVGIIGNGSSAIQILPALAKMRGTSIFSFQRSPTWVVARHGAGKLVGSRDKSMNPEYGREERERFGEDAEELRRYRKRIVGGVNRGFRVFVKGSKEQEELRAFAERQMREKLGENERLCELLIPKGWEVGCRRVTPGEGYLEAFRSENVQLSMSGVASVDEKGVWTGDGEYVELDVLVCATGFDVSQRPGFPVVGREGVDLGDLWKDEPESYMSVAAPYMPNYFIFTGPNATVGHGSLIYSLDWAAEWMVKWFRKMLAEDIASVVPKKEAVDEFVRYGDKVMERFVWTSGCRSWYKNNRVDGRVTATFAGSALLFKKLMEELRPEDFEIQYRNQNRFRFLGNGFMDYELDDDADLAWYVER